MLMEWIGTCLACVGLQGIGEVQLRSLYLSTMMVTADLGHGRLLDVQTVAIIV